MFVRCMKCKNIFWVEKLSRHKVAKCPTCDNMKGVTVIEEEYEKDCMHDRFVSFIPPHSNIEHFECLTCFKEWSQEVPELTEEGEVRESRKT